MKDKRKGNDLNVIWSILTTEGVPFPLEGKDMSVYLRSPFNKTEVKDFKVEGNLVKWTFFGKDQKYTGKYSLILVINENKEGMNTTDCCNFVNLVDCSCKVGGADEGNVQTESLELTSRIEFASGEGGASYDDTEIRNELLRLDSVKADKSELTELSTEVGTLSEKVDELGQPIFNAIFNTTTYNEIVEAKNKGMWVVCNYENSIYHLSSNRGGSAWFGTVDGETSKLLWCDSGNNWYRANYTLEQTSNKTTTISEASTNTQYPSAKAVYDFVNTTLGTLINGEY